MFDCPEFYEFLTHFCAIISDFCAIFIVLCAINHIYSLTFLIPHPTSVIPSLSRDLSTPVEMTQKSSAYRCRQSFAVMIKTVIAHISAQPTPSRVSVPCSHEHYRGENRWSSERRAKLAWAIPSRDRGRQSQRGRR